MSSSQFIASLRAAASISYVGAGPARTPTFTTFADGSKNVRGFSSIARTGGQPTGVLDLAPDDINGFSPVEDTVEITPRHTFNPALPDSSPRINYEILAPDPVTGKRSIRVYTLLWDQIAGTTSLFDIDFDIKIRTTRLGRITNMSSSQTTSSLRAQCSVDASAVPVPAFVSNRGFLTVTRLAGQPAGAFVLSPDPDCGFSPNEDTVTVIPATHFDDGIPTQYYSAYYEYGAVRPDGHRDIIVYMHRTTGAGATALSDRGFTVTVDTTKLGRTRAMSTSQSSTFLRAQCSFVPANVGTAAQYLVNRGFGTAARAAGQPAGVFDITPDDGNGFDPATDVITVTPTRPFNGLAPTDYAQCYWELLPAVGGKRSIRVVCLSIAGATNIGTLADIPGFQVNVTTTNLPVYRDRRKESAK